MPKLHQVAMEKVNYLEDKGYNVVEVWEYNIKQELERDKEKKQYFNSYEVIDPLESCYFFFGGQTNAVKVNVK